MALDANTYGTVERVMGRLGDLFPDGQPSTIDRLDVTTIEQHLDDTASEMNAHLEAFGHVVPIDEAVNPTAFALARTANVAGACVLTLDSMPGLAFDAENPDEIGGNRKSGYAAMYKRFFDRVTNRQLVTAQVVGLGDRFKVGSATDRKTGKEKKSAFTRDKFDFPGSVTRLATDDE